jgi:hypothetical protein
MLWDLIARLRDLLHPARPRTYEALPVAMPVTGAQRDRLVALAQEALEDPAHHDAVGIHDAMALVAYFDRAWPQWQTLAPETTVGADPLRRVEIDGLMRSYRAAAAATRTAHHTEAAAELEQLCASLEAAYGHAVAMSAQGVVVHYDDGGGYRPPGLH